MAEKEGSYKRLIIGLLAFFGVILTLWVLSIKGILPIMYANAKSPGGFEAFLDSPRDDMRGVKVNGHMLDIGKRRSLQVLKGYDEHMYMMRPYRKMNLITRNMTRTEIVDFCIYITGEDFEDLRKKIVSGNGPAPIWKGRVKGTDISIVKVSRFSYLVSGVAEKPIFISQVELAKRFGMTDRDILMQIIPVQDAWYQKYRELIAPDSAFPVTEKIPAGDEMIKWLDRNK